jgi:hypothetical protein
MSTTNTALTALIAALKKAEKAGPGQSYEVKDKYGDTYDVPEQDFNNAEIIEAYDSEGVRDLVSDLEVYLDTFDDSFEVGPNQESMVSYSASQLKAIRARQKELAAALTPTKLYHFTDSVDNAEFHLTEAQYKAIKTKKRGDKAFRFDHLNYHIEVRKDSLMIGCQEHSLDYWKENLAQVANRNLYNIDAEQRAIAAFNTALPYLERMTASLQTKRKPAKKAAKKKGK